MDIFQKFLQPDFQPTRIKSGQVNGRVHYSSEEESEGSESDGEGKTTHYAEDYKRKEMAKYAEMSQQQSVAGELSAINTVEDLRNEEVDLRIENRMSTFDKYKFSANARKNKLCIDGYKDEILSLIKTNMVVVIHGPTGCGKSTQVPQFILDDCRENKQICNIVVTQPRKIAAISLARRVCEERLWSYGTVCGYQVALEKDTSCETILTYMTTGVLLQKIINAKNLHEFTHIIIDEVHERNQDMDFLLLIIRKFLNVNSINTKVILMSATFDTEKFSHYFRNYFQDQVYRAPTVFVEQQDKREFTVQEFFAESLSQIGEIPDFVSMKDDPKLHENLYQILILLLQAFERMEKQGKAEDEEIDIGNVLIFLPGIYEIEGVYNILTDSNLQHKGNIKWYILPLHSSIGIEDQRKVFDPPPKHHRKIILSTNIAESSLTVSDIGYVIDFCLTKTLIVDPETQYHSLRLMWASRANCIQRAGRVGRVRDGRVYRLVTKNFFYQHMEESLPPEILRAPLERIILASKMLDLPEPPKAILALAIDPPELQNIEYSIRTLKEVGGLLRTCKGVAMKSDGDLTFLGKVMCHLPLDVRLSKLVVLGHMFSCLTDCIIMAAGCSLANIFTSPFLQRLRVYTNKVLWADGSSSDLIAHLHLFKVWRHHKSSNVFRNVAAEMKWAQQNYLSLRALREWQILVDEIIDRLKRIGIREESGPRLVVPTDPYTILKIVMCGAFYPNYFKRGAGAGQIDEREAVRTLGGRDPCRTVYFKNMELGHPGILYAKKVKRLFDIPDEDLIVSFDSTSKIYVEFLRDLKHERNMLVDNRNIHQKMPGKVLTQVYRSVKRRQLKMNHELVVMPKEDGWSLIKSLGVKVNSGFDNISALPEGNLDDQVLPTMDIEYVAVRITYAHDAGHFYAQNANEQTLHLVNAIERELNRIPLQNMQGKVNVGDIVAGIYKEHQKYYRCQVEGLSPSEKNRILAHVIFIDYGNSAAVDVNDLRALPFTDREEDIFKKPPQAMECVLYGVQPSHVRNPRGLWTPEANRLIERASFQTLYGKVYSVVHGVVHLELFKQLPGGSSEVTSLNAHLVKQGLAQAAEESFLSKENHKKRCAALQSERCGGYGLDGTESILKVSQDLEPPPDEKCRRRIDLKGPFSPLEMNIYTCVKDKIQRNISIEPTSVNSVLLDVEPQDPHERLIVAAQINESQHTSSLSLRNTTVLPNIHGLPAAVALIFCPAMEPKVLEDGSRYAQILVGLGTYQLNKPIYPEHDIVLTLDTELTPEEIEDINEVRYWMNHTLKYMENQANHLSSSMSMATLQTNIHTKLMAVLERKRTSVEPRTVKWADAWKKQVYRGDVLQPGDQQNNKTEVWPLHWIMELKTINAEQEQIMQNIEEMKDMATKVKPMSMITCKLCNKELGDIIKTRIHLASQEHKSREAQFQH